MRCLHWALQCPLHPVHSDVSAPGEVESESTMPGRFGAIAHSKSEWHLASMQRSLCLRSSHAISHRR